VEESAQHAARIRRAAGYLVDIYVTADKGNVVAYVKDNPNIGMKGVPGHQGSEMHVHAHHQREMFTR
jgi:hypothetical protein